MNIDHTVWKSRYHLLRDYDHTAGQNHQIRLKGLGLGEIGILKLRAGLKLFRARADSLNSFFSGSL